MGNVGGVVGIIPRRLVGQKESGEIVDRDRSVDRDWDVNPGNS